MHRHDGCWRRAHERPRKHREEREQNREQDREQDHGQKRIQGQGHRQQLQRPWSGAPMLSAELDVKQAGQMRVEDRDEDRDEVRDVAGDEPGDGAVDGVGYEG